MGIAAYNRGSRLISEQIAREQKARERLRPPPAEPLCWEDHRAALLRRIAELERDRKRALRCIRGLEITRSMARQELAAALAGRDEAVAATHRQMMGMFRLAQLMERRWRFVSGIVRALLTPGQVQRYIGDCEKY